MYGLRMLVTLVLVTPALAGCGAECDGSYRLGAGFTSEEEGHIRATFQSWNDWADSKATLSPDGVCPIERRTVPDPSPSDAAVAMWRGTAGRIDLDVEDMVATCAAHADPAQCWRTSLLHELGHSFGLDHLGPGEAGVMSGYDATDEFTDADRRECRRTGACR